MHSQNKTAPETIKALQELALELKAIFLRLKKEGYVLSDGVLVEPTA